MSRLVERLRAAEAAGQPEVEVAAGAAEVFSRPWGVVSRRARLDSRSGSALKTPGAQQRDRGAKTRACPRTRYLEHLSARGSFLANISFEALVALKRQQEGDLERVELRWHSARRQRD
jgi:hypothetical protein